MPRAALLLALLVAGVVAAVFALSAHDAEELDRSDANAVFRAALEAVHDADWRTLRSLLTKEARAEMERDLTRLKRRLGHPEDGKIERALARQRLGEQDTEEIRRVVDGDYADALRFYVLIMPRERSPSPRGMKADPFERTFLYASADGTMRPVRLVLVNDEWFVADLQL